MGYTGRDMNTRSVKSINPNALVKDKSKGIKFLKYTCKQKNIYAQLQSFCEKIITSLITHHSLYLLNYIITAYLFNLIEGETIFVLQDEE